jgi:hypothetical protein
MRETLMGMSRGAQIADPLNGVKAA